MVTKCVLCGSRENKAVFNEFGIDVLRCRGCGHVFSSYSRDQNYDDYFGSGTIDPKGDYFWADQAHEKMYNDFCRRFIAGKSGRLLDVGCGQGYFVRKMSGFPSWETWGYEISDRAVDFARKELGLKNVHCGRVEDSGLPECSFDIITLWDVIEHIPDPYPVLSYIKSLLKKEGMLFFHTPNEKVVLPAAALTRRIFGMKKNLHYLEAKNHLNIYSSATMTRLLNRCGFERVKFIHLRPIQSIGGSKSRVLTVLKNGYYYFAVFLFLVSFKKLNLDNLFVAAGKGK